LNYEDREAHRRFGLWVEQTQEYIHEAATRNKHQGTRQTYTKGSTDDQGVVENDERAKKAAREEYCGRCDRPVEDEEGEPGSVSPGDPKHSNDKEVIDDESRGNEKRIDTIRGTSLDTTAVAKRTQEQHNRDTEASDRGV